MSEAIVITGKGGAGKTTVCAALGAALSLQGKKVILADASIGMRGLDLPLGAENLILNHLADVLSEKCSPEEALIEIPDLPGLKLLSAPQTRLPKDVGFFEMKLLIRKLKALSDIVLIDAPAGVERGFSLALTGADRGIIVTSADRAGSRTAGRISGLLQEAGLMNNGLFLNRLLPFGEKDSLDPAETADLLGLPVIGAAADCRELAFLSETGTALLFSRKDPIAKAFEEAAARLLGEEIPLHYPQPAAEKKTLLSRLLGS